MKINYLLIDQDLLAAARSGDVHAQYNIGVMFYEGKTVLRNDLEAAKWFGMAADQGDAQAQFNLGLMFYLGRGVPRNDRYAYELFALAAAQGDEKAQQGMQSILNEADEATREALLRDFPPAQVN